MSFYDIMDEMVNKDAVKTLTGDQLIVGPVVGIVAKNYDPDSAAAGGANSGEKAMDYRVCVTIPTRDEHANELKWARVCSQYMGKTHGMYFMPEVGDQVLLLFEGGNIEKPYVIGAVPKADDKFLKSCVDKDNQFKCIETKHGNRIQLQDHSGDEKGKKDKILVQTAGQTMEILLDNENEIMRIGDKANENFLEFSTKKDEGTLSVKTKSKLTVQVGDKIKLTMNGETGSVSLQCEKMSVQSKNGISMKTESSLKAEAAQMKFSAGSGFTAEGGSGTFKFDNTSF